MKAREIQGRQLLAGLADFLHTGKYPPEALEHLNAVASMVREKEFETHVDGTGHIVVDIAKMMKVSLGPGPAGLKLEIARG